MATHQDQDAMHNKESQEAEQASQKRALLKSLIRERVLLDLGEPADLLCVNVLPLWGDHYRVNVFVGPDMTTAKVAHSFFLRADGTGKFHKSTPEITRQYS